MANLTVITALGGLDDRNEAAAAVTNKYVSRHTKHDLVTGLAGAIIPVPFAEFGAFAEQMYYQATFIYPPMSRELAGVYSVPLKTVQRFAAQSFAAEAVLDLAVAEIGPEALGELAQEVQQQLGADFFASIWSEILADQGLSATLSAIPIAGAAVSAGLDFFFARVMTKRVATMVSIYCQNGQEFAGDRKATYEHARRLNPKTSPGRMTGRTLREAREIPELEDTQVETVVSLIKPLKKRLDAAAIRSYLDEQEFPADVIDKAMRRSDLE
jgi:hypothetical protein